MSPVPRSQALFHFQSAVLNDNRGFTVPDEHVVLVKSMHVHNNGTLGSDVLLVLRSGSPQLDVTIEVAQVAVGASHIWDGWAALNPGDTVYVLCGQVGVAVWVSGAVLAGAPSFPAGRERIAFRPAQRPN